MRKKWIGILIFILISISIGGVLISWMIAENNFPSSITKDAWLQFFGSYLGSVVASFIAIISISLTIINEREIQKSEFRKRDEEYFQQMKDNAKMMVIPAFSIRLVNPASEACDCQCEHDMSSYDGKTVDPSNPDPGEYGINLILSSIGLGNAWFPTIVEKDKDGIECIHHICPENDLFEKGNNMLLTIKNTLAVDENYEVTEENRNRLPIHHELYLRCNDIYMNEYNFVIHLNTTLKETILHNGNWGEFYNLQFERLENMNF